MKQYFDTPHTNNGFPLLDSIEHLPDVPLKEWRQLELFKNVRDVVPAYIPGQLWNQYILTGKTRAI